MRLQFTNCVTSFSLGLIQVTYFYVMVVQMIWNRVDDWWFCAVIQRYCGSDLVFVTIPYKWTLRSPLTNHVAIFFSPGSLESNDFLCYFCGKWYDVELMFSDLAQKFSNILVVKTENTRETTCLSVKLDTIGTIGLLPEMIPVNHKALISRMY